MAAIGGALVVLASALQCARNWRDGAGQLRFGARGSVDLASPGDSTWVPVRLGRSVVWPWLLAVSAVAEADPRASRSLILLRGDVDLQTWRRVAIWLRWSPLDAKS